MEGVQDRWATWLLDKRFGGDPNELAIWLPKLLAIRDKVLDNANLKNVSVLLDVGAGDGLIAFGALERLRPQARIIFSDISDDLLNHARTLAEGFGALDRVAFLRADACDLSAVPSGSVDAVTTRSVLIYVSAKATALSEFFRVLRPGGRISLAEPINRDMELNDPKNSVADLLAILRAKDAADDKPQTDPMLDFTERDLLRLAYAAGFAEVHIELRLDIQPREATPWETYLKMSPNPNAPTMGEYLTQALSAEQFRRYETHMKPLIESGNFPQCRAMAYLWALKL